MIQVFDSTLLASRHVQQPPLESNLVLSAVALVFVLIPGLSMAASYPTLFENTPYLNTLINIVIIIALIEELK